MYRIPSLLATLLLLCATLGQPWSLSSVQAAAPTLPSYAFDLNIDYAAARVEASQTTRFSNATGQVLDQVVFQVAPASVATFQLTETRVNGQPVGAALQGSVLEVPLSAPLGPGERVDVGLSFSLDVPRGPGRLSAGSRALALGNWFPTLAPHRGEWDRHQYTDVGDAFVTEVADFELRLTTSIPLKVASSGRVVEDQGTSFRLQALGVRDFALSLSPAYVVSETRVGDALIRAYSFGEERARLFAQTGAKYLRWYGEHLGRYPYRVLSVADADLPASYGGMEYPGLVLISAGLGASTPFDGSALDLLIGHEIAHQWFYSKVGNDQVQDPWLDEAFAEYLPYAYYLDVVPSTFDAIWGSLMQGLDGRLRALGNLPVNASVYDFPDDGPYFITVYRQGARFLHELRQTMGEQAFLAALADLVELYGDKLASPRAVLDLFQRHTSANLNPLIGRYFSYGAFDDPAPAAWRVEAPAGEWSGRAALFVGAEFPVSRLEAWLDSRRLYQGSENAVTLELTGVEAGEYVLLVRVWDHRGAQYERARRVTVSGR